ncbi:MAG: pyridoxamine 5'-phosphate oxidase [Chloroflexi bacterium]|nr:pyridoxamine 5'-phosphate oxidase [Chloroflexota bacterium]
MPPDLSDIRLSYQKAGLSEEDVPNDPLELLTTWLEQAAAAGIYLPNTMTVATVDRRGVPALRAVILRQADSMGLVFYTNYESRKSRDVTENSQVGCLLLWPEVSRQIRVTGRASRILPRESDAYFATRERGAQIEAWASPQSARIPDRPHLEARFAEYERKFAGARIPRPSNWGGFRVTPDMIEFWQGRPNRMHDRLLYQQRPDGTWSIGRLAP